MADVAASLLIRIDAEDNASAVLAKVSNSVGSLGGAGAAGTKSVKGLNAEMNAGKSAAEAYKSKMEAAAKATLEKKTALEAAKAAYKGETAEANKNSAQLAKQKQSVESLIRTKRNEISTLEQSNSTINKGSQAYKDNCRAIQWTQTELDSLEKQHKSITDSISANEAAVLKSSKAYKTAQEEVEAAEAAYSKYSKADLDVIEKNERAAASLKRWQDAGAGLKSVGEGLDAVTKPLQYAAVGVVTGGAAVSAAAMKYETAFTGVKKTVDGTPEQLQQVNTEIRAMSKNIPVSAAELANLAAVGGQLGVGVGDISKFTEVMAAMGVATNLSGEEGAASMARFLNVMGEDVNNIDRAGSAIVALGNNTATTEADIASMAVRMGKYGKTVGMNTQQVLGYSAALSSMGIEAQLGGSAIGRTWLDIEKAVNSGGDTLNAYAKYAGVSAQDFAKQWSTDPSGAFNGLIKGLSSVENLTGAMSEMGIENTQDQQVVMALANGYDMLTKCLDLSGTAYKENTALMKEANAAYGTTANQIQLTKNAVTDAAIRWGEVLLPEIRSGAQYVGGLADKFGSLDDNTKKTVVSGAKAAVVLGAASKATVGAIKGVGNVAEGVSKIKTAFAAGGAFAKFAPALASVASAAGPATAGIAAVTLAVVAGKKAYDHWYDSTYKWGESLEKPTVKLNESISTMKELNGLQWEYNDLSGKISKGQLDGKELEYAKSRLEEITNILKEKYKIDVDSGDIDNAIEKAKKLSEFEVLNAKKNLRDTLDRTQGKYDEATESLPKLNQQLAEATVMQQKYADTKLEIAKARDKFEGGAMGEEEYIDKVKTSMKSVLGDGREYGQWLDSLNVAAGTLGMSIADIIGSTGTGTIDGLIKGLNIEDITRKISDYEKSINQYKEAAKGLADVNVSQIGEALKSGGDTEQYMSDIKKYIDAGVLSADEYAKKVAQVQTGQADLNKLWAEGGANLDSFVNAYVQDMQKFGASAQETAIGASLLKNGFTELSQVPTEQIGIIEQQATSLLKTMEGMSGKSVKIDVDKGTVSVIDDISGKISEIQGKKVSVKINSEGNIEVLDEANGKIEELEAKGAVELNVKADGNIEVLDEAKHKIAEIDGETGEVTFTADTSEPEGYEPTDKDANVKYGKDSSEPDNYQPDNKPSTVKYGVDDTEPKNYQPEDKTAKVIYHVETVGDLPGKGGFPAGNTPWKPKAKGTQNFSGGLAMVNDQKGISDPRELIIDGGRAFIPQGRNVILPLSKGAKVYTASQTKAIMSGMGIPHYAEGKDNSDAFKEARDAWTHTTKIRAVTVTEELDKWVELSGKFKDNIKDAEDIAEEIFTAARKVRD